MINGIRSDHLGMGELSVILTYGDKQMGAAGPHTDMGIVLGPGFLVPPETLDMLSYYLLIKYLTKF